MAKAPPKKFSAPPKADNGKGFKKVPKGGAPQEKSSPVQGTTKFVPPWMKKNTKGAAQSAKKK